MDFIVYNRYRSEFGFIVSVKYIKKKSVSQSLENLEINKYQGLYSVYTPYSQMADTREKTGA